MSEYIFIGIGTVLLIPLMLLLPSVFSRKVTALLVILAGALTAGASALLELYPWWVPLAAVVLVLILISAVIGAKHAGKSRVEDGEEVEKEEKRERNYNSAGRKAADERRQTGKPESSSGEGHPENRIVHKQPLEDTKSEDDDVRDEEQLLKRRKRLYDSAGRD
ncbi:hypothetical protein [Alteribacter natronophilus]|uniref:hypothetical protein n=1 Tax=Alteribacter natronophilus TaxID=2583810 RepID=UPI00110D9248|nr:hypothetical protein [Alteribacter natronophilus]TMW71600.1 hypothetical protein FGB90_11240 [Alteribacter natronophilus]